MELCTVREAQHILRKKYGLKIGYTGIMHYRKNHNIPIPTRGTGKHGKEKYYDVDLLYVSIRDAFRHNQMEKFLERFPAERG